MKVLLIADEFFSWGIYGGFGAFTRKLGKELIKRGVEVEVIVQKISELQKEVGEIEIIDGVSVKTLPRSKPQKIWNRKIYLTDANIIHSQCGLFDAYLSFKHNRNAKKIVTIQDLRTKKENKKLNYFEKTSGYPLYKRLWKRYVESCFVKAMKNADIIAYHVNLLIPKIKAVYGVEANTFLPNFVDVSNRNFKKANEPTVVWLGRLDPIKQPEKCFELAKDVNHVQFYVLGASHNIYGGKQRDRMFKRHYQNVKNLHFLGFQSGEVKEEILGKAWILINTSVYECLPVSFLEALGHKCALLSTQNPDNYTSKFGVWSMHACLKHSLDLLLKDDYWRTCGKKGYEYVKKVHSTEKGVDTHLHLYRSLLA